MPTHYPHLLDPTIYPDYRRRPIRVPTWKTFDGSTQLTTLRGFTIRDNRLVDFVQTLDLYQKHGLGRVIWPNFSDAHAENFNDLVAELKRRDLYLFDIWGHVPGSEPRGWGHVVPLPGQVRHLRRVLGAKFLGFDNGEQDGRYIGTYASQQCPAPADRFRQYLNLQRFFERMGNDLGNDLSALISLSYGHYFAKEGNHNLLGAETAQALPNSQIYYAFIRGACKQYGILWFGNASVYNRWGFKSFAGEGGGNEGQDGFGPTKGTSTNLMKRLIYSHYLYNCVAVGFESVWLMKDDSLTPIGHIQAGAGRFIERHGQPGTMHTPVALLLDPFSGWCVPRHLYMTGPSRPMCENLYLVWGTMPYDAGDYLTHNVLGMLYPGYEDASYYHDERGFLSATPHGDMADCLLSDVPGWVLSQYGLVVAAGRLSADLELRDKLEGFVTGGGHLVITAENARGLWPQWQIGPAQACAPDSGVQREDGREIVESAAYELCPIAGPVGMKILAHCGGRPAVAEIPMGRGRITLLLSPFGIHSRPDLSAPVESKVDKPLPNPFRLLAHVRDTLREALAAQQIFSVGVGLGFITCRKGPGQYVLGIYNNDLTARPFRIVSHAGRIEQVSELSIEQSEKGHAGYWPEGFENTDAGATTDSSIAGGDVRLFAVTIREEGVRIPDVRPPAHRACPRLLALRDIADLKTELLRRPTFFEHFDGAKVDWTYIRARDRKQLQREGSWLKRRKVRIIVDLSPGVNFYPDLTLLDTFAPRYKESVAAVDDVLAKMKALGAADAVFSLHRNAENHVSQERAEERFLACVRDLCLRAARRKITLHLQSHPYKWRPAARETLEFIGQVTALLDPAQAGRLRFALNTCHARMLSEPLAEVVAAAGERLGLILLSAPARDVLGNLHDAHVPIKESGLDLAALAGTKCPVIFDANYASWDEVYTDINLVNAI